MKGNTKAVALSMAAIFALSILALGVMAYTEPTGNLVMTSSPQLLIKTSGYARIYDWVSGQFSHTWSGTSGDNWGVSVGAIGDVDNDGTKEVVTFGTYTSGKGKNVVSTRNIKIWNNGDASGSPSLSFDPGFAPGFMKIGDVNGDSKNELVMLDGASTLHVWSCDGSGCTEKDKLASTGSGGLNIGDSDNDGTNEILVGESDNYNCHAVVIKYANNDYSIVADLGPANTLCCVSDPSVGDLDGTAGNEIFGSGYCSGNMYVWQYSNGAYNQVWTTQRGQSCFHMDSQIADVNGDGSNDFAFTEYCPGVKRNPDTKDLVVYKYSGNNVWAKLGNYNGAQGNLMDTMYAADLDSDSKAEVVVQNTVWDWDGSVMKNIQTIDSPVADTSMA